MLTRDRCAACGGEGLRLHLRATAQVDPRGLIPTTTQFGSALADIFRCERCGHRQVCPMPDDSTLSTAYADAESFDYVDEERGQRATARRWLEQIEAHAAGRGDLLDLGCWVGYLLSEAQRRGWNAIGVEPSEFASELARERVGVEVITGGVLSVALTRERFDVVSMNDVIEHLTAPGEALVRARELLRPNGLIALVLPDAGSAVARIMGRRWWSVIPTHVQYFTRHSIRTLLERTGFELVSVTTAPKAFTVGYYLDRVSGYSRFAARKLVAAAATAGMADRLWAPDFRDRMAVIARLRSADTSDLSGRQLGQLPAEHE